MLKDCQKHFLFIYLSSTSGPIQEELFLDYNRHAKKPKGGPLDLQKSCFLKIQ